MAYDRNIPPRLILWLDLFKRKKYLCARLISWLAWRHFLLHSFRTRSFFRDVWEVNKPLKLESNNKMLLLFKLFSKKNYPDKKQIDAASNCSIFFYCFPCSFHFTTPVN